jgi:hypothetical protein
MSDSEFNQFPDEQDGMELNSDEDDEEYITPDKVS